MSDPTQTTDAVVWATSIQRIARHPLRLVPPIRADQPLTTKPERRSCAVKTVLTVTQRRRTSMSDPIWIECEGSGCPVHPHPAMVLSGICSMCGAVVATYQRKAVGHRRQDILAMLERGDFGA